MSRIYDAQDPNVIDESLLRRLVDAQTAEEQSFKQQEIAAGPNADAIPIIRNANNDPIEFHEVQKLRLGYENILKIDNLWHFKNLVELKLDNNILTTIDGIGTLKNLKSLDLSFNNISKLSGLDNLTKLEDLILSNNRITQIEAGQLSNLKNLKILNLSTNLLTEIEDISNLRCLPNLASLVLKENNFHSISKELYHDVIICFLPNLQYLDFRMIHNSKRAGAFERFEKSSYATKLIRLEEEEKKAESREICQKNENEKTDLYTKAHVIRLSKLRSPKNSLFLYMFEEDTEGKLLLERNEVCKETEKFRNHLEKAEAEMFNFGLEQYQIRQNDLADMKEAAQFAIDETTEICRDYVDQFLKFKRTTFSEMNNCVKQNDNGTLMELREKYELEVSDLWKKLMTLETDLVDRLEETLQEFVRDFSEFKDKFVEQLLASFALFREIQTDYFENVKEIASEALDKIARSNDDTAAKLKDDPYKQALLDLEKANRVLSGETDDNLDDGMDLELDDDEEEIPKLSEDAKIKIYADKETVSAATTASNDCHTTAIDNVEDAIKESLENEISSVIENIKAEEAKRNRKRLAEVTKFIKAQRADVDYLTLG